MAVDLDGTLVFSHPSKIDECRGRCEEIRFEGGASLFVYVRPFLTHFLLELYDDPRNVLVLFSAGSFEYVHAVVDRVIRPLMREIDGDWDFAAVYTGSDLVDGCKDVEGICGELKLEDSILIDDVREVCMNSSASNYSLISRFDPTDGSDRGLLDVLNSPFFSAAYIM